MLASLDPDEPHHPARDRLVAEGGHTVHVHELAERESRGVCGGAVHDWLHLAATRQADAEALVTMDRRDLQALSRPGDPRIESP